jgi:para-nitrobenzyl esterase
MKADRRNVMMVAAALTASALPPRWLNAAAAEAKSESVIVDTASGKVRGTRAGGIASFRGIPYGTDTSQHRFQPARAAEPWTGVRDCVAIGHQAPQMEPDEGRRAGAAMNTDFVRQLLAASREGMEVGNEGEDCLVLNVYTPEASRHRRRPVMFWMHGGGFAIGSGGDPQYDGAPLARRGFGQCRTTRPDPRAAVGA